MNCSVCNGELKYRDSVKRIVKSAGGKTEWILIERYICVSCGSIKRMLPEYLLPYKHYRADIIRGAIAGQISMFDLEYEDYPCEMTFKRWRSQHEHTP